MPTDGRIDTLRRERWGNRPLYRLLIRGGANSAPHARLWAEHVVRVAQSAGILVILGEGRVEAHGAARAIYVPRLVDAASYAATLHELGHLLTARDPRWRRVNDRGYSVCVRGECSAWIWATDVALPKWGLGMFQELRRCLTTYEKFATAGEQAEIDSTLRKAWFAIQGL